jgi:hypothetical protein
MRPIDKTSSDLFQKLRSRFSPVTLGNEKAEATSEPSEARFFNFLYTEDGESRGTVSISLVDGRSMKVFYGDSMTETVSDKEQWYAFLKELRNFAKRNLLTFDARDIAKGQLDSRDLGWLGKTEGSMDQDDVTVTESAMWGSKRRSYQTLESVKLIVQHTKTVDESVPGARSRSIKGIYLERSDGERYHFPFNYLTGARAMARHVAEGGTPYDAMGSHILGMIKEMRDLSKFARMTRTHALEDSAANDVRQKVIERFQGLKSSLSALANQSAYREYAEQFKPSSEDSKQGDLDELRERFTRKIWDQTMEELLPAVTRAIASAQISEAPASVEKQIKDPKRLLVLKNDPAADQMLRRTKFNDAQGLMGFVLSDIATRAIGDDMDALANFAADVAERIGDRELDQNDKRLAMLLVKRYMDDIKSMIKDPSYAEQIRKDPSEVYGKKKKRTGGFHEAEAFEAWANDVMEGPNEAADDEISAVANAIIRRIMTQHPDLIEKHGPEKIMQAADSVADFIGDVEEIGSSDVSAYMKYAMDELGEVPAQESAELAELQTLSGTTRVDPRDPKAMTKVALSKVGITTGEDPKTGALTVGKGSNRQQVQAALKAIAAKSKGKLNPTVVMQGTENDAEPVMEKELKVKGDQDGDGDEDFADVMIARRVKSGEPKAKAIAATKDKPYNEADVNEDKLMAESLNLIKVLAGI